MLTETLEIIDRGYYSRNGARVDLKLGKEEMKRAVVYLPDRVEEIFNTSLPMQGTVGYTTGCVNMDSYECAAKLENKFRKVGDDGRIAVLNFASSIHPGGGVRRGARAQEEGLCRHSTLLISLEGKEAEPYYIYNRGCSRNACTNAMIFTPEVEIIRNSQGELLEETRLVSVVTCAAPVFTPMPEAEKRAYYQRFYQSILRLLKVLASCGYRVLVLGAWGCGVFGNDPGMVSDLFRSALEYIDADGTRLGDHFTHVEFAVLDRSSSQANYREFFRNFG